jgi:hypothetical protein
MTRAHHVVISGGHRASVNGNHYEVRFDPSEALWVVTRGSDNTTSGCFTPDGVVARATFDRTHVAAIAHAWPCGPIVTIDYTNWRDERRTRQVVPLVGTWRCATTEWHPRRGWLFDAIDLESGETKSFALAGVHAWTEKM